LLAAVTYKVLRDAGASAVQGVTALTHLAGSKYVGSTRDGIENAIAAASRR
jgi:hypothetical protein